MLRSLLILCIFWLNATASASMQDAHAHADVKSLVPEIEKYIEKYRDIFHVPGVAIVIVKDGKVYIRSFGTLSLSDKTPIDADTVFPVASVTKNFTATLITKLAQKGVLSLDDKVTKYLPDFKLADKDATDNILVRDLLCHCVGLADFAGDSLWHAKLSQKEVVDNLVNLPFTGKLRAQYAYSNIMVGIAGLVVEKATGKPIADVMREEFFEPLSMDHSSVGYEGVVPKISLLDKIKTLFSGKEFFKYAKPHDIDPKGKACELNFSEEFYLFPGSCGVNTTANDMAKWLLFHLNNYKVGDETLISPEFVTKMRTAYVDGSKDLKGQQFPKDRVTKVELGLGWFMFDFGVENNRIQCLDQMGGTGGVRSLLTIVPSENLGIAIISNLGGMRSSLFPEAVTQKFLDMYLKIEGNDYAQKIHDKFLSIKEKTKLYLDARRLKNPKPHAPMKTYEGVYTNKIYGEVQIVMEGDKNLVLQYRGNKVPLKHINDGQFMCMGRDLTEGFESDDLCLVDFGVEGNSKAYGLMISLLDEGENPAFYRVEGQAKSK